MSFKNIFRLGSLVFAACLMLGVSGCATMSMEGGAEAEKMRATMKRMENARRAYIFGEKELAIELLHKAAKKNHDAVAPWVVLARIHFKNNNYIKAISAAHEVLLRNPSHAVGNSIMLVSGLRLAASSLEVLTSKQQLTGSVRDKAETLAKYLRNTLNEDTIVGGYSNSGTATFTNLGDSASQSSDSSFLRSSSNPFEATPDPEPVAPDSGAVGDSTVNTGSGNSSNGIGSLNPFESLKTLP